MVFLSSRSHFLCFMDSPSILQVTWSLFSLQNFTTAFIECMIEIKTLQLPCNAFHIKMLTCASRFIPIISLLVFLTFSVIHILIFALYSQTKNTHKKTKQKHPPKTLILYIWCLNLSSCRVQLKYYHVHDTLSKLLMWWGFLRWQIVQLWVN